MENPIERLRKLLADIGPGAVPSNVRSQLERLLAECWDSFGGDEGGMEGYKLLGRMEKPEWNAPNLTFTIARHGGTVMGSTRAELQEWTVNLDALTASTEPYSKRYRQLSPRAKTWKAEPVAEEIAQLIINRKEDPEKIKWLKNGGVTVLTTKVIPDASGPQQTYDGRRRRLNRELGKLLSPLGWERKRKGRTWKRE